MRGALETIVPHAWAAIAIICWRDGLSSNVIALKDATHTQMGVAQAALSRVDTSFMLCWVFAKMWTKVAAAAAKYAERRDRGCTRARIFRSDYPQHGKQTGTGMRPN